MFRRLSEQDHYQVLEVRYDASSEEIQSAYEEAREIYSREALVSFSILSEQDRRRIYERVAEAYQTLIAEESRRLYDESLGLARRMPARSRASAERAANTPASKEIPAAATPESESSPVEEPEAAAPKSTVTTRECPIQLGLTEEATGDFLKRAREILGLDLATIAEETKIGVSMLEYIENERLDRLPAPVYLRNFALQMAHCLGLDEEKVSRTYLARIRRLQNQR